jgi:hypothetical protein
VWVAEQISSCPQQDDDMRERKERFMMPFVAVSFLAVVVGFAADVSLLRSGIGHIL